MSLLGQKREGKMKEKGNKLDEKRTIVYIFRT